MKWYWLVHRDHPSLGPALAHLELLQQGQLHQIRRFSGILGRHHDRGEVKFNHGRWGFARWKSPANKKNPRILAVWWGFCKKWVNQKHILPNGGGDFMVIYPMGIASLKKQIPRPFSQTKQRREGIPPSIFQHLLAVEILFSRKRSDCHLKTNGRFRCIFPIEIASWWFFPPIWKICSSNWIISPGIGMNIKNIWKHHLE